MRNMNLIYDHIWFMTTYGSSMFISVSYDYNRRIKIVIKYGNNNILQEHQSINPSVHYWVTVDPGLLWDRLLFGPTGALSSGPQLRALVRPKLLVVIPLWIYQSSLVLGEAMSTLSVGQPKSQSGHKTLVQKHMKNTQIHQRTTMEHRYLNTFYNLKCLYFEIFDKKSMIFLPENFRKTN